MMARQIFSVLLLSAVTAAAQAGILPTDEGTKWQGSYTGSTDLNWNAGGTLNSTFTVDSPWLNQGNPATPAGYTANNGTGPGWNVPTYPTDGSELIASVRDLKLVLAWDKSSSTWVSGANLTNLGTFTPTIGDVLFFGDPTKMANGQGLQDGGQFAIQHNTSGAPFVPTQMDPSTGYGAGYNITDNNTGASVSGSDVLLSGVFENLKANGVYQTSNLALSGVSLLDASIPVDSFGNSLADYAVFALDVFSPFVTRFGTLGSLGVDLPNWVANVDLTGGSELASVMQNGLQIESAPGVWTGNTTDLRLGERMVQIPGSVIYTDPNSPDLTTTQGSFTFVSAVPEPSTLTLYAIGGLGLVWMHRRRQHRSQA